MNRFTGRMVIAALALAVAGAPAVADARGGNWGGGHGGYHHHHGGGGSSSDGWWIGGAFALATVGLLLAANSGPSYVQTGVYSSGVGYTSPPLYAAPVYSAPVYEGPYYSAPSVSEGPYYSPPVAYAAPQPQYQPVQYESIPPVDAAQAGASADCQRWAMNQSGYDPATISQWTTQVMVDSYNHSLDSCMTSRGYRAH
ncbi:hypothetical protein D3C87_426400 [compost metagenome]